MSDKTSTGRVLADLYAVIEGRRGANPGQSYTAHLFDAGTGRITEKVAEEAAEVTHAALNETAGRVVSESADLLYHLLVLWADLGIRPEDVMAELAGRAGTSGIAEKKARPAKDG